MSHIPEWAIKVAAERCNEGNNKPLGAEQWQRHVSFNELARTIAKHEEPPVDPLLVEARDIVARQYQAGLRYVSFQNGDGDVCARNIRSGMEDKGAFVQTVLTALRRGVELGKSS